MRLLSTLSIWIMFLGIVNAQTTVFSDDFEAGLSGWTLTGDWGLATSQAFNGSNSLADSPAGYYLNNVSATATTAASYNFSSIVDASCHFKVKYDIENGFDTCYVDMSLNGGTSWQNIDFFNGEGNLTNWQTKNISLGGAIGSSAVKLRFRMFTDGGYVVDGIFIDSFRIVTSNVDNSPPFIVHNPLPHYEGQIDTNYRVATISDYSGVASAILSYQVDGVGAISTLTAIDTTGNNYMFAIPQQAAGAFVKYWINATDSSAQANTIQSDTFKYVAGNYIKHDNAVVTFIDAIGTGSALGYTGIANRMSLPGNTTITTALVRTYTDVNNPADSIEIHVWANSGGNPGADLITPITVFPSASISYPNIMTVLDLRPYANVLDSLQGDVFIGFLVPSGNTYTTITSGTGNGRGRYWNGTSWVATNAAYTYHFRVVTDEIAVAPTAAFSVDNTNDPTFAFVDESTNSPTSWSWNFNSIGTSTVQNPNFTFTTPGFKNVCLTVSNFVGSNTHCESITVTNSAPAANFNYTNITDPTIPFTNQSLYNPQTWFWDFGDGTFSSDTNPTHTFYGAGFYDVCLAVSNIYGDDTLCKEVAVLNELPVSQFGYTLIANNFVLFQDQSSGSPTSWKYYYATGDSSSIKNPNYQFPLSGGEFEVCLTASNQYGKGLPFCDTLTIPDVLGMQELSVFGITIGPNPANDYLQINSERSLVNTTISLIDMQGKAVKTTFANSGNSQVINTADLSSGVYILQLKGDDQFQISTPVVIRK